jgi:hypothetical protein
LNSIRVVHIKQRDGGTADGRQADDPMFDQRKMLAPDIEARMEQSGEGIRLWIDGREVRPFVQIAPTAGQRKVLQIIGPAVLPRADVLHLKSSPGQRDLGNSAILAPLSGPLAHRLADRLVHDQPPLRASMPRAFA